MSSYKDIVKSTGLVGGSQVITIILGILKSKIFAVFLGPVGVGLFGMYTSILSIINNTTLAGINVSGVKFIAQSRAENDDKKTAEIKTIILRLTLIAACIGSLVLVIFSEPISIFAFESKEYSSSIRLLSIASFFTTFSLMQTCIMQGMQRIGMMVKTSLVSCIVCFIVSVVLVYFGREGSIIWVIVSNAVITWIINKLFLNKIEFTKVKPSLIQIWNLGKGIIKLGGFLILSELLTSLVMFLVKWFISTRGSMSDVGIFQASWTLSVTYVGIVLSALMTDYFPRISKLSSSELKMNTIMNEQTQITLLIGIPCAVLMQIFLELGVCVLYSSEFFVNTMLYRLMIIAVFTRFISFPIGYILLVQNHGKTYIAFSSGFYLTFIILSYFFWDYFGISGVGMGYCIASFLSLLVNIYLVKRRFPLKYSRNNSILVIGGLLFIVLSFLIMILTTSTMRVILIVLILTALLIFEFIQTNKICNIKSMLNTLLKKRK